MVAIYNNNATTGVAACRPATTQTDVSMTPPLRLRLACSTCTAVYL